MLPEIITRIPGPNSLALGARLRRFESPNVTYVGSDFPVFWERAEGVNVWDVDGNCFLDLTSAFGVAGLGHGNAQIVEALSRQAGTLVHAMGDVHPSALKAELCARLSALTFQHWDLGEGKTILGNSGFEAVEAALKTALVATGKPRVITFEGAYHGLGYGALAAGGQPFFRDPFVRQLKDFGVSLPFPSAPCGPEDARDAATAEEVSAAIEATRREIKAGEVGAILIEPIQGRGGIRPVHPAFLRELRRLCDESGALLVFDEIYTGFNRTAKLFACDHYGVRPDIVCLGKALTSGFPLSACVARAEVMDAWPPSEGEALHTSTFLGSPLGCAMALESLRLHEDPQTAARVAKAGDNFRRRLEAVDSPFAGQVRGVGLMLGLELIDAGGRPHRALARAMIPRALQEGMILLGDSPEGNVLALTPPFAISDEEITWTGDRLQEYLMFLPGSIS